MKKIITVLLLFSFAIVAHSQLLPDSVLTKYKAANTNSEKGKSLLEYFQTTLSTDSSKVKNMLALSAWFKQHHDETGADYTDLFIAYAILAKKTDYAAALNMCFDILPRMEKRKDNYGIMSIYLGLDIIYMAAREYEQSAKYSKMYLSMLPNVTDADREKIARAYNAIGCIYGEAGKADSGLVYAQKAVNMDVESKNIQQLALSISTLAENYIAAQQYDIALPFLRKSFGYYQTKEAKTNNYLFSYLMNDFAQVFLATHQYDSANYYAHKALQTSVPFGYKDQNMRAYEYLYKSFEETKNQDSTNIYFRMAITTKDSLFNVEKAKSIEALSFREQLRQQELATEKIKADEERQQDIQYALIALTIISFVIIFLVLSRRHITNTKLIQFLSIVALLVVFEFLNLLLHPFLERITHHSPVLMLLSLVCIASLLVPFHHKLEHWATHKLIENNKAIRLAKAKKTIEKLDCGS